MSLKYEAASGPLHGASPNGTLTLHPTPYTLHPTPVNRAPPLPFTQAAHNLLPTRIEKAQRAGSLSSVFLFMVKVHKRLAARNLFSHFLKILCE